MLTRLESLHAAPECAMGNIVNVKPKLQQRPWDAGYARNMGCSLKRTAGLEWSHPGETTHTTLNRTGKAGLPESIGAHVMPS